MKLWKLLRQLWSWGDFDSDVCREPHQGRNLDSIHESEVFGDAGPPENVFIAANQPDRVRTAELLKWSAQRVQPIAGSHEVVTLSVVAVDYVLEREWTWLLRVVHGFQSPGPPAGKASDPTDQSNRTVSDTDRQWSIVAPID